MAFCPIVLCCAHSGTSLPFMHSAWLFFQPYTLTSLPVDQGGKPEDHVFWQTGLSSLICSNWKEISKNKTWNLYRMSWPYNFFHLANGALSDLWCSNFDSIFSSLIVFFVSAIHWNNSTYFLSLQLRSVIAVTTKRLYGIFSLTLNLLLSLANCIIHFLHLFVCCTLSYRFYLYHSF